MDVFARLYNHGIPSGIVAGLILASWVKPVRLEGVVFLVLCAALIVWCTWVVVAQIASAVSNSSRRAAERASANSPPEPLQESLPPTPAPLVDGTGASGMRTDTATQAHMSPAAGQQTGPEDTSFSTQTQPEDVAETVDREPSTPPASETAEADSSATHNGQSSQSRAP